MSRIRTHRRIEYLDHNFINTFYDRGDVSFGGTYTCDKCKLYVCIKMYTHSLYVSECVYLVDKCSYNWKELDMDCGEVVIKNIIE